MSTGSSDDRPEEWEAVTVDAGVEGYRRGVCAQCPFRLDAPLGRFPAEAFAHSRRTAVQPEYEPDWDGTIDQSMFACHMAGREHPLVCAGFLATCGRENLSVRFAVAQGLIDTDALTPDTGGPALYDSYDAMVEANLRVPAAESAEQGFGQD